MDDMISMISTHPNHMRAFTNPPGVGGRNVGLEQMVNAGSSAQSGSFEDAMLHALDRVSGMENKASELQKQAIINPDSVQAHDITIAQAMANMSLNTARNVLNRLVQGWRDIINTR
jgi:flagellar hook-basal body complex protein FliE